MVALSSEWTCSTFVSRCWCCSVVGESIFLHTGSQSLSYSPPRAPFLSSFVFIQISKSDGQSLHLDKLAMFPAKCNINLYLTLLSNRRKHFSNLCGIMFGVACVFVCKPFIFFQTFFSDSELSSAGRMLVFAKMCCVKTVICRRGKQPHLFNCFSSVINTVAESSGLSLNIYFLLFRIFWLCFSIVQSWQSKQSMSILVSNHSFQLRY